MPHLERYWSAADPDYCDWEGAESFATLLRRCEAALARLAAMPAASLVYVFGHGQFIQAARAIVADRSEEHTSELQSLMRISYAVFCLKKKKQDKTTYTH